MGNTSPLKSSAAARSYSAERSRVAYSSPSRVSPSRKPVLRRHDEDELVHALKDQCNFEQELENAKINLAHKSDFNLYDAFNIFDLNRNGLITTNELVTGLSAIGIFPTFDEAELFVTRYDKSGDRRLSFHEF
jgi:hypothetical protein